MNHPAPGFEKHPGHTMVISPAGVEIAISVAGQEIARTEDALLLAEASYPAVYYLPVNTLPADMLVESDHQTYCPFKGEASYCHLVFDGNTHENAVWSYRTPYDEALPIKDHIAIYANVAEVKPVD